MPEMTFTVRWPDGCVDDCYSPSLVVHDHLQPGTSYSVEELVRRVEAAMTDASERVRARFGFACSSAAATRAHVRRRADAFAAGDTVHVVSLEPSLPQESR